MCGIIGAFSTQLNRKSFESSVNSLVHRGPDNTGIYNKQNLWLGHTRLSINDLSPTANQPFINHQANYVVVFNGEIYNYRSLREELKKTVPLVTNSEVEVLAYLYMLHGKSMLAELDGMFAFVIFDVDKNIIFGARDRLGKKPLFYHLNPSYQEFYFSSELSPFKHFDISYSLDTRIIDNILNFTHFDGESILQGIISLPAGFYFTFELDTFNFQKSPYFNLVDLIDSKKYLFWKDLRSTDRRDHLESSLDSAVKKRLISDVPVGIIASGGLDSSLVSSLANRHAKYNLLHIDSVDSSELDQARLLSKSLKVDLIYEALDYKVFSDLLHQTIERWEYPLVHNNATGILLVSQLAKKRGYKVLLGGEGADELFAGYPQHRLFSLSLDVNSIFSSLPTKLLQAIIFARTQQKGATLEPTIQHFINRYQFLEFYERYSFIKSQRERQIQSFLASELLHYLVPLLSRADRMTMAAGVEMRLPFLDIDIVEMALNMPLKEKMNLWTQKKILRRVGHQLLPKSTISKKKVGFTVDYSKRFLKDIDLKSLPFLDNFFPTRVVLSQLKEKKQYHKMIRLYSLDKLCSILL